MSAAGTSTDAPDRVAAALRDAEFARLVATADGDALAATGLLARALEAVAVPYQASLATVPDAPATDADCTVAIGHPGPAGGHAADHTLTGTPLAVAAAGVVRDLAPDALDPVLALAGAVCAGEEPSGTLLEAADLDRHPGVAVPTEDRIDGLAGSTLVHADFSGDGQAAETALDDLGTDADDRDLASYVALSAVQDAPPRAATAVERALRPYECDRFGTLGGFADVLDAVARERPGTGIALALGHDVEDAALETWRAHGQRAHAALRAAGTARYDGVFVGRLDDPDAETANAALGTVARLLFEYRSPEPVALVVADGEAAAATESSVGDAFRSAATALDGSATVRDGRGVTAFHGVATFDGSGDAFLDAFREEL